MKDCFHGGNFMIRVTGRNQKSEIAHAIQQYNESDIYSYYEDLLPFAREYHASPSACTVEEFCKFIMDSLEEKVKANEYLPISMIVIYTNLDEPIKIAIVENYIKEIEKKNLVGNVVFMTQ